MDNEDRITIMIKTMSGQTIDVEVRLSAKIGELKLEIEAVCLWSVEIRNTGAKTTNNIQRKAFE
jgi:hypothetical protein